MYRKCEFPLVFTILIFSYDIGKCFLLNDPILQSSLSDLMSRNYSHVSCYEKCDELKSVKFVSDHKWCNISAPSLPRLDVYPIMSRHDVCVIGENHTIECCDTHFTRCTYVCRLLEVSRRFNRRFETGLNCTCSGGKKNSTQCCTTLKICALEFLTSNVVIDIKMNLIHESDGKKNFYSPFEYIHFHNGFAICKLEETGHVVDWPFTIFMISLLLIVLYYFCKTVCLQGNYNKIRIEEEKREKSAHSFLLLNSIVSLKDLKRLSGDGDAIMVDV